MQDSIEILTDLNPDFYGTVNWGASSCIFVDKLNGECGQDLCRGSTLATS